MPNINLTDLELIKAIGNDDEKALNELFERYWSRVYAIAYRYVKDEEVSLEITHDIFLNLWNKRHELQINSVGTYIITAAGYHGIRKRQTLKSSPIQYVDGYQFAEDAARYPANQSILNEGENNIQQKELDAKVERLLNDLPKRCKEIYALSRQDNLSISEISTRLKIFKRTVENQLTNALKHLRTSLKSFLFLF